MKISSNASLSEMVSAKLANSSLSNKTISYFKKGISEIFAGAKNAPSERSRYDSKDLRAIANRVDIALESMSNKNFTNKPATKHIKHELISIKSHVNLIEKHGKALDSSNLRAIKYNKANNILSKLLENGRLDKKSTNKVSKLINNNKLEANVATQEMKATRYGIDEITKHYSRHVDGSAAAGAVRVMNDRVNFLVDSLNKYIDKGNPIHRSGSLPTYHEAVDATPSSISLPPTFHDATRNPNVDGGGG
ncbi:hypothetical protein [Burkholderia contaminans]|uniref:hypothetical protein n=1 Tax=Burkholderia contaminans TaxID=488447 RepID=UPI0014545286|nr:hypothetical protein [Burkholderia contaminans]VWD15239.1 hypothetical protein BCO18442_03489 [Burkholderia contaminans]